MYDFYIYKGKGKETKNFEGTTGERVCSLKFVILLEIVVKDIVYFRL